MIQWDLLRAEFQKLTPDRALADQTLAFLSDWMRNPLYAAQAPFVRAHIELGQFALLLDSFHQFVPFGTGGRRGRVGYGPNRINEATVALSVQGHCDYLRKTYPDVAAPFVVVAFDTRIFVDIAGTYKFLPGPHPLVGLRSRDLARQTCEIYAGNGVIAYFPGADSDSTYVTTPELSFLIRHLKALGGVNISASHNHPDDNGFKFYDREGGQEVPPTDEYLMSFMNDVREVKRAPFEEAVTQGLIRPLPADSHSRYIALNLSLRSKPSAGKFNVVYTPLCGTGDTSIGDTLRAAGFDVELYGPHANFDGTFAAVPSRLPNPEVPGAARPALETADRVGASLVLSSDPDADRIGVLARAGDGSWRYLTGNDIAIALAYYLAGDELGPRRRGIFIKTLVTTRALEGIARDAGCQIVPDLLVGFKYIANVLDCLDREGRFNGVTGRPRDLVLAAEESHGVLLTPEIHDKDAAGGALLLCELCEQLYGSGRNLPEYLERVSLDCGNYACTARSIVMRGIQGAQAMASMMRSLREDPPRQFGARQVVRADDYQSPDVLGPIRGNTDRQARNLLRYMLDGVQVVIRPSGTEPKAKVYVDVEGRRLSAGRDKTAAERLAKEIAGDAVDACLERVGARLEASAKLLPDYVDLDLKQDFGERFSQDLGAAAARLGSQSREERLVWLRKRLSAYAGGADPLETVSAAVADLAKKLRASAGAGAQAGLDALLADLERSQ